MESIETGLNIPQSGVSPGIISYKENPEWGVLRLV